MSRSVILVGGNLVSDTEFRKKLAGRDSGVELQMVVEDLLSRFVISLIIMTGIVS